MIIENAFSISTVLLMALLAVDGSLSEASAAEPSCTETCSPTRALSVLKPGKPVPLEEGFRDPPAICRVQCWWQCHGSAANVTHQQVTFTTIQ